MDVKHYIFFKDKLYCVVEDILYILKDGQWLTEEKEALSQTV